MNLEIASPCRESWDRMRGDERVRFCGRCSLHVYDLSALSEPEALHLVKKTEGKVCVRFYQRRDGTILTRDCPVGWARLHQSLLGVNALVALFAAVVTALVMGEGRTGEDRERAGWWTRVEKWWDRAGFDVSLTHRQGAPSGPPPPPPISGPH
jgi:hypothetical protein